MVKQILHNMRPLGQGTGSRYFSIRQEQIHAWTKKHSNRGQWKGQDRGFNFRTQATSLAAKLLSLTNLCCLVGSDKATAARQHKVCWSERQRCLDKTKLKKKLWRCPFGVTLPQCKWRITFFFFFCSRYFCPCRDPVERPRCPTVRFPWQSWHIGVGRFVSSSFSEPVFACGPEAVAQHKGSYCQHLIQGLHSFSNMVG